MQDLVTQDYDVCVRTVGELGKFQAVAQRFQLLRAGETFDLRSHQVLELQVLSCLEKPFNLLCHATTNYEHHCCQQTAAKLLAAVASLTAGGDATKLRDVIIAGVARKQKMYLPGKGLALYPPEREWRDAVQADNYWGRISAQHLCDLSTIIEDWSTFAADIPVKIQLSKTNSSLQPGNTVELIAEVKSYQPGLLLQVCWPPALSRWEGGGEVKRFSVDFCGQKTLRIPLRVTGYTSPAGEHWRAVVRNMFNEEETGNSGLLRVQVGG
ncbi:hypothetical protein QUA41_11765 [Microcoleus sp. Pol11C1]|uniref:hypothetical protein n=1 Tax=unclassified Microcoleus TaxID=2642155 RepID=UPI002FD384FA